MNPILALRFVFCVRVIRLLLITLIFCMMSGFAHAVEPKDELKDALRGAATRGDVAAVQKVISQGADVNSIYIEGTALSLAVRCSNLEVVKVLLASGADTELRDGNEGGVHTALIEAAETGRTDILSVLVAYGAKVDGVNSIGETPLMRAAYEGKTNSILFLLSKGARLEARSKYDRYTPLLYAAENHQTNAVRLLLDKGAEANVSGAKGMTALMLASIGYDLPATQVLIEKGANINAQDDEGWTALLYASRAPFFPQSEAHSKRVARDSPAFQSAHARQVKLIEFLIAKGANTRLKTKYGGSFSWPQY